MDMTGEFIIPAPRQKVWEALNDPAILQQCIPGCESIEKLSDTELQAKVVAKVGPVRAHFGGKVTLSDLDPPKGYRITGEGSGGAAGFAKGGAAVQLSDEGNGTRLSYQVDAHVGGKLAQIGSRLIDATARKMAEDFFTRFSTLVAAPAPATTATPAAEVVPEPAPARQGLPPIVWVSGLIILIAVLLYFFTRGSGH
ncbi:MAG TPA: carbon monoxide dehydrogenase subunit G [Stellaceae bacterium]|nr:carbon monoxide dehydrogenase subunit G [Stellaceae bacterium]